MGNGLTMNSEFQKCRTEHVCPLNTIGKSNWIKIEKSSFPSLQSLEVWLGFRGGILVFPPNLPSIGLCKSELYQELSMKSIAVWNAGSISAAW